MDENRQQKLSANLPGAAKSALEPQGTTLLNKFMAAIDPKKIAGMQTSQKVELFTQLLKGFGLTAKDFNLVKGPVSQRLGEAKQPINEDAVTFLTQIGLPTIGKALSFIADGNFDAAGNAIDTLMTRPAEAGAMLGAIAAMVAGGGALGKLAAKAVALLNKKEEEGDINLDSDQEKTIDKLADKIPAADMQMAMQEVKSYYKQKALLEAKRRNSAKRK
jgi:hypothetical protein